MFRIFFSCVLETQADMFKYIVGDLGRHDMWNSSSNIAARYNTLQNQLEQGGNYIKLVLAAQHVLTENK